MVTHFLNIFFWRSTIPMLKNSISTKMKFISNRSFWPVSCSPDSLSPQRHSRFHCYESIPVTFISLSPLLLQMGYVCILRKVLFELGDCFFFSCHEIIKNEWLRLNCRKHTSIYYLESLWKNYLKLKIILWTGRLVRFNFSLTLLYWYKFFHLLCITKKYIKLSKHKWFPFGHHGLRDLFQVCCAPICP